MLADYDFSYGVSVMQNIETTIQTCHKLLLVVSQHSLQSAMCDKEVDMAHKYAADTRRNDFMLVLRLDESKMPLKLNYMTYINGVGLEVKDVGRKVGKAFYRIADVQLPQNINGIEILRKHPIYTDYRLCCSSSYELCDLSRSQRNELFSWSIEESQECYRKIREEANDHFLLKRYAVFVCGPTLMCVWMLLVLGITILFASLYILLSILTGADTSLLYYLLIISSVLIGLTICLYTAYTVYIFHQMMSRLYSIVRKNIDCKSQNYIVIPRRHWNDIFISFIYYDMKPCWKYLEQRAREYWPDDSEEDIAGSDWNPIPQAASIRHNTYQNRCCLCMVAKSPWTKGKSALNVIPEQGIENNQDEETCVMKIAESEIEHETFVKNTFEIDHEHFESTEENDETSVMKIVCNSSDSHVAGAVSGSPRTEAGSGFLLTGAEFGKSLTGAGGGTSLRGAEGGTSLRGAVGGTSLRGAVGGTSLREAEGGTFLRGAVGGTSLRGAEGGTSLRGAEGGTSLRGAEGGTSLRGAEGGTSLRRAVGGTSLTETVGGSLLDSNIDRWYGNMCETRVRGEVTSTQQPQVSHELITWRENPVNLTDSEISTSLNDREEAVPLQSGDEELQWYRGEHVIDEATHAKVPR
ncbi:uncharacterized protein LOC110456864 isoform X2 [Mizuhopecten yessoensis]|uniref:uncharacterized protein LOC110456864 isoform X2 n=1 Tax=Mizuhopecten yessoensis TaxID=6573 RepID=UPI000B4574BE|nr:uncharacterized protein LOC110456864 isoform X2 [Mizuhopecten yessoensis]